jgi:hypothetical protein
MTEEIGSDAQLAAVADLSTLEDGVKEEQRAHAEEDLRLAQTRPADDEPGEDFPEPEPPPHDEPHDEYEPMPPT